MQIVKILEWIAIGLVCALLYDMILNVAKAIL